MIFNLKGDATYPQVKETENVIIPHITNNIGAWGAGFVIALSKRWKEPEAMYRELYKSYALGSTMFVQVEKNITVANMTAQNDIISNTSRDNPPIDYVALEKTLKTVYNKAKLMNASVHMPKIGSGLAGGDWSLIEKIIDEIFADVDVYVYIFN